MCIFCFDNTPIINDKTTSFRVFLILERLWKSMIWLIITIKKFNAILISSTYSQNNDFDYCESVVYYQLWTRSATRSRCGDKVLNALEIMYINIRGSNVFIYVVSHFSKESESAYFDSFQTIVSTSFWEKFTGQVR